MNFTWQGQSCCSTSRLMIHEDLYDAVLERVANIVASLRVGDPMRDDSDMGPINSAGQYRKVMGYIESGNAEGARLLTGGSRPDGQAFAKGYWVSPPVFADVHPHKIGRSSYRGKMVNEGEE